MPKVVLNRTSEYINRFRNYSIYIDGKKVGTIANGETKEFNVSSGQHSLVSKIDWCSSPTMTFNISDNEIKNFNVGGFKNAKWVMPAALIMIVLSYVVNYMYGFEYLIYLVVPAFLLLVYFLTVGRKRYLILTQTKTENKQMTLQ